MMMNYRIDLECGELTNLYNQISTLQNYLVVIIQNFDFFQRKQLSSKRTKHISALIENFDCVGTQFPLDDLVHQNHQYLMLDCGSTCKNHPPQPILYIIQSRDQVYTQACSECIVTISNNIVQVKSLESLQEKWRKIQTYKKTKFTDSLQQLTQAINTELLGILQSLSLSLQEQKDVELITAALRAKPIEEYCRHEVEIDELLLVQQCMDLVRSEAVRGMKEVLVDAKGKACYFKRAVDNLTRKWESIRLEQIESSNILTKDLPTDQIPSDQEDQTNVFLSRIQSIPPIDQLNILRHQIQKLKENSTQVNQLLMANHDLKLRDERNYMRILELEEDVQQFKNKQKQQLTTTQEISEKIELQSTEVQKYNQQNQFSEVPRKKRRKKGQKKYDQTH